MGIPQYYRYDHGTKCQMNNVYPSILKLRDFSMIYFSESAADQ